MNALAAAGLAAKLAIAYELVPTRMCRPLGPAGVGPTAIFLARSGVSFSMVRRALMGLWIHDPTPEYRSRLLPLSSHDRTSLVIVFWYSSSPYATASFVCGELSATVLPS